MLNKKLPCKTLLENLCEHIYIFTTHCEQVPLSLNKKVKKRLKQHTDTPQTIHCKPMTGVYPAYAIECLLWPHPMPDVTSSTTIRLLVLSPPPQILFPPTVAPPSISSSVILATPSSTPVRLTVEVLADSEVNADQLLFVFGTVRVMQSSGLFCD